MTECTDGADADSEPDDGPSAEPALTKKKSWLDPEAPMGTLAVTIACAATASLTFVWWVFLRVGNCGIDAGGGPPPPPTPSSFGQNDLLFALIGAAVIVSPALMARSGSSSEKARVVALRFALAGLVVVGFFTLQHLTAGADYWPNSC